jgi:hypothetical protein
MAYLTGISPTLRELVTPTVDVFAAGVGFTAGSSTSVTLSADPGNENNVIITMDGVVQHHDTYSVSGTTLTFDAAIPTGTTKIEARYAQEHPNYTVVADDAVTLAKMASGTDGNVISYDASGNPVAVATGSDGQVLTSAGAGAPPVFEDASGGWTFVSSVTASSSATLAFTNMASGYDYDYQFASILPATDAATMKAELGIAGPTYRTSNYKDSEARVGATSGTSSGILTTTGIAIGVSGAGNQADEGWRAYRISLYSPADSGVKTTFLKQGVFFDSNVTVYNNNGGGIYTTAEAQTSIKFALSSGNIASGVIKQYRRLNT